MEQIPELVQYIESLDFINKEGERCRFTALQKQDMGLVFQKRYALLNWQQGSGKTAVAFHYGKYRLLHQSVTNVLILAPAIAVNLTWEPFLERNGESFISLKKPSDFRHIKEGQFILLSVSMMDKLKWEIKRYIKHRNRKICFLFDESDEITNPLSQRTRLSLCFFRKLKYKLLATGTTTRNNITELYSQLELLYNNSMNMMCFLRENAYSTTQRGRDCRLSDDS